MLPCISLPPTHSSSLTDYWSHGYPMFDGDSKTSKIITPNSIFLAFPQMVSENLDYSHIIEEKDFFY